MAATINAIAMKQLSCLRTMSNTKQWMPEQEPEPGTEIKSGDLYLLSSVDANANSSRSSGSSRKRAASRYPVHVKVYRSCFGHYAVVTASLRAPATYLNLRTCNSRPCGNDGKSGTASSASTSSDSKSGSGGRFRVELGGGEGQVIYFEVNPRDPLSSLDEWVSAFQGVVAPSPGTISPSLSPVIPRSPIMPTLQESIEEEEEEEEEEEGISGLG